MCHSLRTLRLNRALLLAAFALWSAPVRADTILLNDGTEVEGRILEETEAYVKMEVQVSKSIKDTRILQRADIKQVTKETPDAELYAKMKAAMPPADRLNVSDYEELLTMYPRRFATEFPSSPLLPAVSKIEAELEAEKAKVASGSVKLEGKWVTPDEIATDPYNHQARLLAADIRDLLADGETSRALQEFDVLETKYGSSTALATLYAPILETFGNYEDTIKRALVENPIKLAEREKQLSSLDTEGKNSAQGAFKREMDTFMKDWETARAQKQKWLPTNAWDKKSLEEAAKTIATERSRLQKIDPAAKGRAAALLATSFSALAEGRLEAAELQITKAAEAGVDSATVAAFRTKLTTAKTVADATDALEAAKSTPAPKVDDPAPTDPPMKGEPKPTSDATTAPPAKPVKTETPETVKPKAPVTPKDTPESAMKGTARDLTGLIEMEETPEEKKAEPAIPFRTILFILVGAMIAITILAKVFSKPKPEDFEESAAEEDDEEEITDEDAR